MALLRDIVRQLFGTFVAVLSGWIAGILFGVPLAVFDLVRDPAHASPWELLGLPYLFGVGAPLFIVPVWLFALIPLYFLVPRLSPLWRPAICAGVGAAVGICIMAWSFAQPNTNPPAEKWSWYVEADGMPIKSACIAAAIGVTTLNEWRDKYPEIEERMNQARERFREKALQTIKKAIDNDDWRAAVAALKLVFPEYRESSKVDVTATAQVSTFVLSEEMRLKLIERREKALQRRQGP